MVDEGVEKLYKNFAILAEAKGKFSEYEHIYEDILLAVKGSKNAKRLASQFIARFFKHFPEKADKAINAQLDLCEDEDVTVRVQAVKDLPSLCRDNKEHLPKIADVLCQLLQSDDSSEMSGIHNSLMSLFHQDARGTIVGIFSQIMNGEDVVRDRSINFLYSKLKSGGSNLLNKEAETVFLNETRKVMQDVTAQEFNLFMKMLAGTGLAKTLSGQTELIGLASEQAGLGNPFDSSNEGVDCLLVCLKHALPYFSTQVKSTKFVEYICCEVLPMFITLSKESQLELLKILAELTMHTDEIQRQAEAVGNLYERLLEYMPLPPTDRDPSLGGADETKFEFTYVECLMFASHRLGRQYPQYLTENPEFLKDFRLRLQYFARGIQSYIGKLRESLREKKPEELKSPENRIMVVGLKTCSNINSLIKDLFHTPPSYKTDVTLSWKSDATRSGEKRKSPIKFDGASNSGSKQAKGIYSPPTGKYSKAVASSNNWKGGSWNSRGSGRSRGANRGKFRGGGRGRARW